MAGEREERDATPKEMPKNTPDSPPAVFETFDSDDVDKDDQDLFSRVKLTAGLSPRPRPISAIEREKELIETLLRQPKGAPGIEIGNLKVKCGIHATSFLTTMMN